MAINKFFIRYKFSDAKLNVVLQDLKRKTNELIDQFLETDFGNLSIYDTDQSDILTLKWDEDDSNPRDFKFKVNKGDRILDLSGDLTIESDSILNQDYTTDASVIFAGLTINGDSDLDGAVTINESNADKDFRVEGSGATYTHLLFTDASTNRVGINENAPVCLLHARLATCADYAGIQAGTVLLLENDGNVRLHMQGATTGTAYIDFCDNAYNAPAGRVAYDFANDWIEFVIATSEILRLKTGPTFDFTSLTLDGAVGITGVLTLTNEGLHILDTNASHDLIIKAGSDLTVDRILSLVTGDVARTITLTGNPLLNDWFDQSVKQASSPSLAGLYLKNSGELRFYDNGNYVGFEAPALSADQIWVLPSADGNTGDVLSTDGNGNLSWVTP